MRRPCSGPRLARSQMPGHEPGMIARGGATTAATLKNDDRSAQRVRASALSDQRGSGQPAEDRGMQPLLPALNVRRARDPHGKAPGILHRPESFALAADPDAQSGPEGPPCFVSGPPAKSRPPCAPLPASPCPSFSRCFPLGSGGTAPCAADRARTQEPGHQPAHHEGIGLPMRAADSRAPLGVDGSAAWIDPAYWPLGK